MPRLDFYVGYELQATIKLDKPKVSLGRDANCEIQMPDPKVSRVHALIQSVEDGHRIENKGANGTRVNNQRIEAPRDLNPGDAIFISSYILIYQSDEAPVEELASTVLAD